MACFALPLLPVLIVFFPRIFALGLMIAAPLNLVLLPAAFHALRGRPDRAKLLRRLGLAAGGLSPLGWLLVNALSPDGGGPGSFDLLIPAICFAIAGAIAGAVCARLWHKHGDRASIFAVNAALDHLRSQQS
jgi:MFS family permease